MPQKQYMNEMAYGKMGPQYRLAHAYIPYQVLGDVYCPAEALSKGTLFPKLYMPYHA